MSKHCLENIRNIRAAHSPASYMINYKLVINLKGLNFVEPSFANIRFDKDAKVKSVVHKLTETDLARIVTSKGETYKLVEAPVKLRNKTVIAKTLRYKEKATEEIPVSKRYMKILIAATIENKLSNDYVKFLKSKKKVYYTVLSEIFAIRVYFWVKVRAR